ncbi:acyl carrier protein [Hymenobacter latericoloratus]|uniref:Acyl carrier protein n=2 Tax=Hymenobacteraceae TaxID=1853232 RepID=A0ABR6K3G2_9BACT|nr:acyl carrier protein [Hymenobacter latericoloratus]
MVVRTLTPFRPDAMLVQQVRRIIHHRKGIRLRRLHLTTQLSRDLGFDTVDVVDIILELERAFQLTIPDEVPLQTIGDFVRYVSSQLPPASQASAA